MIHSLYSNKEIFLRELISNASDALDKLRFAALSDANLIATDPELRVEVSFNEKARTITIRDNGIGMSEDEVVANIGTIAKSGTKEFLAAMAQDQRKDASLIGQFGVGFYSAFIVAERVVLETVKAGNADSQGVRWESKGEGDYSIEKFEKSGRGTTITLYLKESEAEFASEWRLRDIIHRYSEHIPYPIMLETPPEEGKTETKKETINSAKALWLRSKSEIKPEEYDEFYQQIAHDMNKPLTHVHSRMEGNLEYTLLFYIPENPPMDMVFSETRKGVRLYVKRVFIMDDPDKLLPKYLRFVRGLIDSSDLPLNVSREILQENRVLEVIKSGAVKKILAMIEELASKDKEKFNTFWKNFGPVFKEGIVEDFSNKEKIASICRFASTHTDKPEQETTLDEYISRMKAEQKEIYFVIGESFATARGSAQLEVFRKRGIEVLLLSDRVDHWVMNHLATYKEKKLMSITSGDIDLSTFATSEEKEELNKAKESCKDVLGRLGELFKDKVKEVRASERLTTSPACLVSDSQGIDARLKRVLEQAGQKVPDVKPVLEVNPSHFIIRKLAREDNSQRFNEWAQLVYDQAILGDGGQLEDPSAFVSRLNDLLLALSLN